MGSRVSGLAASVMAFHGPSYGLSRECAMKSQAKFSPERAKECVDWIEEVIGAKLEMEVKDQVDFGTVLKDGAVLCQLINAISPGSVKKINTMKAPFKQRENIEMYLKACAAYGLKEQDLFQVNDLYENKRQFDEEVLKAGQSMIGLQYGTNKGASQAGMTPYGASRQIRLEDQLAYKMNLAEH